MTRLLLALTLTLAIAAPAQAQTCPTTSVEAFTPVVPIGTTPTSATNPRQARIDPIGQVVLYDYSLAGFSYVAWQPRIGQYAYVVIGDATVGPPGGNGTVLRLDSLCRITLLVQPTPVAAAKRCYSISDFSAFAAAFGGSSGGRYDLNGDGRVDLLDFSLFAAGLCQ